jgi:hypothetical protein
MVFKRISENPLSWPFESTAVTAKYQVPGWSPLTVQVMADGLAMSMLVRGKLRYDVP